MAIISTMTARLTAKSTSSRRVTKIASAHHIAAAMTATAMPAQSSVANSRMMGLRYGACGLHQPKSAAAPMPPTMSPGTRADREANPATDATVATSLGRGAGGSRVQPSKAPTSRPAATNSAAV